MVSTSEGIRSFKAETIGDKLTEATAPITTVNGTESVAFDGSTDSIFYTNTAGNIMKVSVRDGSGSQSLVQTVGNGLNGIAVDWNDDLIYYTNKDSHSINVVSKDGTRKAVILTLGENSEPADIVLNPESK